MRAIGPPAPKPATPHVVLTTDVASVANDAVVSGGDLWVIDLNAGLVRVEPATGRVKARVPLGGASRTIAAGPNGLWVIADDKGRSFIVHIDPRTGRVLSRHAVAPSAWSVFTADAGGLWLPSGDPGAAMERVPAPGRAPTAFLRLNDTYEVGVLATPTTLWAVANDGTLVQADNVTGRIVQSLPRAVTGSHGNGANDFPENGLAGDADGVWAVDQDREIVVRFTAGRIVQRSAPAAIRGRSRHRRGALWVSVADTARRRYKIVRFDLRPAGARAASTSATTCPRRSCPAPRGCGSWRPTGRRR